MPKPNPDKWLHRFMDATLWLLLIISVGTLAATCVAVLMTPPWSS